MARRFAGAARRAVDFAHRGAPARHATAVRITFVVRQSLSQASCRVLPVNAEDSEARFYGAIEPGAALAAMVSAA